MGKRDFWRRAINIIRKSSIQIRYDATFVKANVVVMCRVLSERFRKVIKPPISRKRYQNP